MITVTRNVYLQEYTVKVNQKTYASTDNVCHISRVSMLFVAGDSDTESESDESGSDDAYPSTDVTGFQDNHIRLLLDAYSDNKRPNKSARRHLSQQTGLKSHLIQIWFQNKRAQDKQFRKKSRNIHTISDSCVNNDKDNISPCDGRQHTPQACNFQGQNNNNCYRTEHKSGSNINYMPGCKVPNFQNETADFDAYQLYCPLDYLLPNEMPPNVDLSSVDICNGEVVVSKQNSGSNRYHLTTVPEVMSDNDSCSWLSL